MNEHDAAKRADCTCGERGSRERDLQAARDLVAQLDASNERLTAERDAAKESNNLEVAQFNAGFEVAVAHKGKMPADPREFEPGYERDMDSFGIGFAWGGYERVIAERDALKRERDRLAEQVRLLREACAAVISHHDGPADLPSEDIIRRGRDADQLVRDALAATEPGDRGTTT